MSGLMQRRRLIAGLVMGMATASVFAAPKTYKYRCPKCNLIQEYSTQGVKKCPNDGKTMIRMN